MAIASALSSLNLKPTTPGAPATAQKAAPNNSPVSLQPTSSLPLRTPPNQVSIRPPEIFPHSVPALAVNVETVVSEFAAEVIVDHKHIKSETKTPENMHVLKLDGLPLSESAVEEMAAASGAVEEQVVEAMDETHSKKRKESSSHKYAKIAKDVVNIALDVATFIPFAGSISAGIRLVGYAWDAINRGADVAKKIANRHEPKIKEDSLKRAAKVGHEVLSVTGKILGLIPGLGIIGGAISLVDDVIKLSEHVLDTNTSFV